MRARSDSGVASERERERWGARERRVEMDGARMLGTCPEERGHIRPAA